MESAAFLAWLAREGVPEAARAAYDRGAEKILELAGREQIVAADVDHAVVAAELEGASPRVLANVRTIGEALLRFQRETYGAAPDAPDLVPTGRDSPSGVNADVAPGVLGLDLPPASGVAPAYAPSGAVSIDLPPLHAPPSVATAMPSAAAHRPHAAGSLPAVAPAFHAPQPTSAPPVVGAPIGGNTIRCTQCRQTTAVNPGGVCLHCGTAYPRLIALDPMPAQTSLRMSPHTVRLAILGGVGVVGALLFVISLLLDGEGGRMQPLWALRYLGISLVVTSVGLIVRSRDSL